MIQSVSRAIDLLHAVTKHNQGAGVSELARACGLKVQTAQTLLKTLAHHDLLHFDKKNRNYRLGLTLALLGEQVDRLNLLADFVLPRLDPLHRETGETVSALALQAGQFVLLGTCGVDSAFTRQQSGVVMRHPCEMASGRVLAGRLPQNELATLIAEHLRSGLGPEPGLTPARLSAVIADAGTSGKAAVRNEAAFVQAFAVAMPVEAGHPDLALGCSIPLTRYTAAMELRILQSLRTGISELASAWKARGSIDHTEQG